MKAKQSGTNYFPKLLHESTGPNIPPFKKGGEGGFQQEQSRDRNPPRPPFTKGGIGQRISNSAAVSVCGTATVSFICFLAAILLSPSFSSAAPDEVIKNLAAKLERWDVEDAWQEMKPLLGKEPKNPQVLELASQIAFHRGDYDNALTLIRSAAESGSEDERSRNFALFLEGAIAAISPLKKHETAHFVISLDEKQDGILAGYLADALEKTHEAMARRYGFEAKEKVRVEIFPDTRGFFYASTLSARDIEVTGAVGVTQFNKLMLLSPRALVYGYRWLDSVSHEYMHYLIVKLTANRAPIWFHEGLAKYEETRWRNGPSYLSPLYQNLLGGALSGGRLIKFEKMEPSLVKLETPEEVQLAYAQAASAIEFIQAKAGPEAVGRVMKGMAASSSRGASEAIRETLDMSFPDFEESWKKFLASKDLKDTGGAKVRPMKIKEGKANEESLDMEEIKSMVARNRAHLGDLLKQRGRTGAAVLEYRRALAEAYSVPILNRLAGALLAVGREGEALDLLKKGQDLSPDHPTIYTHMGEAYLKLKNFGAARDAFQESIQINPFNPEVHQGLAAADEAIGDPREAAREREITRRLTQ